MSSHTNAARDPRRIAYVVSRFPKLSETFILREIDELDRLGWRIDVWPFIQHREDVRHPEVERWMARVSAPDGLEAVVRAHLFWLRKEPQRLLAVYALTVLSLWRSPVQLIRGLIAVARATAWARRAHGSGVSHVHAHFALHPAVAALAIAHLAHITFSFTGHAHDIYRDRAMLAEKVHQAHFVVVVSRLLRDQYIAPVAWEGDMDKVHVIRCGVETALYRPRSAPQRPCPFKIVAVARLVEFKGLTYLIDACRILRKRGHDIHCDIIGDGPLRETLRAQVAANGLDGCVTLLGARSQGEVMAAFGDAGVLVLPSIVAGNGNMEGVPVSLMEAMALGIPVVATRTGAVPELVEDLVTGLLVPPGNAWALAMAVERLATEPTLTDQLVETAREHVNAAFDIPGNVLHLHHLLSEATQSVG